MKSHLLILVLTVALHSLATVSVAQAQDRASLNKKIEDLRKVKLLEILDLQDDQVEKFFSVYNRHQKTHDKLKRELDALSAQLQEDLEQDASDAVVATKTEELRKLIRQMGDEINSRFDDVKNVLSKKQYAQYVVFEARFRDELQRKIMERVRKQRRDN